MARRPTAGQQTELVECVLAGESALGQARSLLGAVDSAGSDIDEPSATMPSAIEDIQAGINQAGALLAQGNVSQAAELAAARDAAAAAVAAAQSTGSAPIHSVRSLS